MNQLNKKQPTKETFSGEFGTAVILTHDNKKRDVQIHFNTGLQLNIDSKQVDLEETKSKTLTGAIKLAVEKTGKLHVFEKSEIKGTKALVILFRRSDKPSRGYAMIVKKGIKPLRFALDRIDLTAMKAETIKTALEKTAFETGAIRLLKQTTQNKNNH